jgi:hypothetical protein
MTGERHSGSGPGAGDPSGRTGADQAGPAGAGGDAPDDARDDAPAARLMTDAEERFAERLAVDLERVLGEGVAIADLEIAGAGPVSARVVCFIEGHVRTIEIEADDVLDAYRRLILSAAELRLSAAWWQIVGPS